MDDIIGFWPIAETMQVVSSDGTVLGRVTEVWSGLTDLESAREMEFQTGEGDPAATRPELEELPEGTSPLGDNRASYIVVDGPKPRLYVPYSYISGVDDERVGLTVTAEQAVSGIFDVNPSTDPA